MSSPDDDGPSEQEVRDALRALRDDDEPSLAHVVALAVARLGPIRHGPSYRLLRR